MLSMEEERCRSGVTEDSNVGEKKVAPRRGERCREEKGGQLERAVQRRKMEARRRVQWTKE